MTLLCCMKIRHEIKDTSSNSHIIYLWDFYTTLKFEAVLQKTNILKSNNIQINSNDKREDQHKIAEAA